MKMYPKGGAREACAPFWTHFHYVLAISDHFLLIFGLIFEWGGDLLYYNPINSNPITPLHNMAAYLFAPFPTYPGNPKS